MYRLVRTPFLVAEHVLDLAQLLGDVECAAFHPLTVHLVKHQRVVVDQVHLPPRGKIQ